MSFLSGIGNGLSEIWAHKLRSFLTMLCVAMGVASVVISNGFVDGLFEGWKVSMAESGGLEKIRVERQATPNNQRHLAGTSPGLSMLDAERIREFCPGVVDVSPELTGDSVELRHGSKTAEDIRVMGGVPDILPIDRYEIVEGRALCDLDSHRKLQVIVIGSAVAEQLFEKNESVVGKTIQCNGIPFVIVGLLKHYEKKYGSFNLLENKNRVAFLPFDTMRVKMLGRARVGRILVRVTDTDHLQEAAEAIQNVVTQTHRGVKDCKVHTNEENVASYESTKKGFMLVGSGVGAVALLVGGIGIMNLMLASIHERVREIGLRKAIGAWASDIFLQFLVEAVTLAMLGGLIGIAAGAGVIQVLQSLEEFRPLLSMSAITVGFSFSVLVGVLSGLYPAIQASRLDPIEALRYE